MYVKALSWTLPRGARQLGRGGQQVTAVGQQGTKPCGKAVAQGEAMQLLGARIAWLIFVTLSICGCQRDEEIATNKAEAEPAVVQESANEADYQPTAATAPSTDIYLADLVKVDDELRVTAAINITQRDGYDNQPFFTPDGQGILYTSARGDQSDIFRYHVGSGETTQVTDTPASEFSPTIMPGGNTFSTVHEDAQSLQLWHFEFDGRDLGGLLNAIQPVGYHAWIDANTVALAINSEDGPPSLKIGNLSQGTVAHITTAIGRCLHKIPRQRALSFTHQANADGPWRIMSLDIDSNEISVLATAIPESQDYAWMPNGTLVMGSGSKLYHWQLQGPWQEFADLSTAGVYAISRIAISPRGNRIAIVGNRGGNPE